MASGALFGNASRSQSKNLIEFRAGKMSLKGKMVHADKRKGMLYIYQSEDSLMHFCWKDRSTGKTEEDLIIFPEDTEFIKVSQCTTGRVFLLKFKNSTRKLFYWVQEPKTDKDEDNCKKVNDLLNSPPQPGSSRGSNAILSENIGDQDLQNIIGNMNQQQLMQLLSSSSGLGALLSARPSTGQSTTDSTNPSRVQSSPGPRASTAEKNNGASARPVTASVLPTTGGSGANTGRIQLADLQSMLTDMPLVGSGGGGNNSSEPVDISSVITAETLIPLLSNPQHREALLPHLPEVERLPTSTDELKSTVKSPHFQQALQTFSTALASGQLAPVIAQFGYGSAVQKAAETGDVIAFAKALQEALKDSKN